MPNHPITLELISRTNLPLATTSANISGNRPGIQLSDFYTDFNNKLNFMIDSGIANLQIPSTIVSVDNNQVKILREGSISRDDIQDVLEKTGLLDKNQDITDSDLEFLKGMFLAMKAHFQQRKEGGN